MLVKVQVLLPDRKEYVELQLIQTGTGKNIVNMCIATLHDVGKSKPKRALLESEVNALGIQYSVE